MILSRQQQQQLVAKCTSVDKDGQKVSQALIAKCFPALDIPGQAVSNRCKTSAIDVCNLPRTRVVKLFRALKNKIQKELQQAEEAFQGFDQYKDGIISLTDSVAYASRIDALIPNPQKYATSWASCEMDVLARCANQSFRANELHVVSGRQLPEEVVNFLAGSSSEEGIYQKDGQSTLRQRPNAFFCIPLSKNCSVRTKVAPLCQVARLTSFGLAPSRQTKVFSGLLELFRQYKGGLAFSDNGSWSFDVVAFLSEVNDPARYLGQLEEQVIEFLREVDFVRCGQPKFENNVFTDPGFGVWELWNQKPRPGDVQIRLSEPLIARNPLEDVLDNSVVAIDFGTKSTVVVRLSGTEPEALRIGASNLMDEVKDIHYENPTILRFVDLQSFIDDYASCEGRPETQWRDLFSSHAAKDGLEGCDKTGFASFFTELKQWAGNEDRMVKLRDGHGLIDLKPYAQLDGGDFDPIEAYAYFIGLFVNNRIQHISLDYVLSFPVTFDESLKSRLLDSFRRGIRKSLPQAVLDDEKMKARFSVEATASEPAAYAASAMKWYEDCLPQDGQKIAYGVFDFGGGTTDFDFGIMRETTDGELRLNKDYAVEHFNAGGDAHLGGENLLEILAYEVYQKNANQMREEKFPFLLPFGCKRFVGSESLIQSPPSLEARLNLHSIAQELRPFWERHPDFEKKFEGGVMKASLYNMSGERISDVELTVDLPALERKLRERIGMGVTSFFLGMRDAFPSDVCKGIQVPIRILLAGNSSKSPLVKELFEEAMKENEPQMKLPASHREDSPSLFKLYPPLGTTWNEGEYKIRSIPNCVVPTGKTGVAFGLIELRPAGGPLLEINKNVGEKGQARFKFYVGKQVRARLVPCLRPDSPYGEWMTLSLAPAPSCELFFTEFHQAAEGKLLVQGQAGLYRKKVMLPSVDDSTADIIVRCVESDVIEVGIGTKDKEGVWSPITEAIRVDLGHDLEESK